MKKIKLAPQNVTYWLSVIIVGLTVGLGIQFTQAWTAPTAAAPGGNVLGPVTTGASTQWKEGALGIGMNVAPKSGMTLDVSGSVNIGAKSGLSSKVYFEDGGNPGAAKSLVANSTVIGFLNESGTAWLSYWNNSGDALLGRNASLSGYLVTDLMYDGNQPGYYVDPGGTSRMNYPVANNIYSYGSIQAGSDMNAGNAMYANDYFIRNVGKWASQLAVGGVFGGIFDDGDARCKRDGRCAVNPLTGGYNCPAGFTERYFSSWDDRGKYIHTLKICYR